jgi:predicted RNA methylase
VAVHGSISHGATITPTRRKIVAFLRALRYVVRVVEVKAGPGGGFDSQFAKSCASRIMAVNRPKASVTESKICFYAGRKASS